MKIDHIARFALSPKITCYSQQIHGWLTKTLDNKAKLLKNKNLFTITILQKL